MEKMEPEKVEDVFVSIDPPFTARRIPLVFYNERVQILMNEGLTSELQTRVTADGDIIVFHPLDVGEAQTF